MKLLRTELKSGFKNKLFEITAGDLPDRGTDLVDNHILCTLSAKMVHFGFQISGEIRASPEYECDRCLSNYRKDLALPFKLWLTAKKDLSIKEGDDFIHFPENLDSIELNNSIADIIGLSEPIKKTCSKNCKGLCSKCGGNLNNTSCNCEPDSNDSPWDDLNKIKFK